MEEPGGEMEASDRRLCCEVQTDKEIKKKEWRMNRSKHIYVKAYLTLSLLSALTACLHNGCHTSHPEEEREKADRP